MKLQTQLLLACIAAALVMSRGVLAGAGTHAMPVRTVEDDEVGFAEHEEEAAYPQRRVLAYNPQSISYGGLEANKAACYGSCPGRGQPYTGRGCKAIFGCRGR